MKTQRNLSTPRMAGRLGLLSGALAFALATPGFGAMNHANATGITGIRLSDEVQVAPGNAKNYSVREFAGQHVHSSDNQDLGTVKDFIVAADSGRVLYAVVSSGGILGMGNTLHVIPAGALKQRADVKGFTLAINQSQWALTPTLNEDRYEKDRLAALGDQERKKLSDLFGMSNIHEQSSTMLLRASEIRGKKVNSDSGGKVGNVENVLVDLHDCSSGALVDPNKDFTGSDQKYVVPISKLQISSAEQDPIRTSITRSDFQNAKPVQMGTASASE